VSILYWPQDGPFIQQTAISMLYIVYLLQNHMSTVLGKFVGEDGVQFGAKCVSCGRVVVTWVNSRKYDLVEWFWVSMALLLGIHLCMLWWYQSNHFSL
jgi:hypothetical protein